MCRACCASSSVQPLKTVQPFVARSAAGQANLGAVHRAVAHTLCRASRHPQPHPTALTLETAQAAAVAEL